VKTLKDRIPTYSSPLCYLPQDAVVNAAHLWGMNTHSTTSPTMATTTRVPDQVLRKVLSRVGRDLATRSRREQSLPPQVEDPAAIAGFVDLWQRPAAPTRAFRGQRAHTSSTRRAMISPRSSA
jgi:hypothetical protein